ncbi:MAG TPA: BTAD domain-containing putative transcriptional regulator, partial [Actinomycetota bacterium]|nr:BTAD domain-containing putative transcriptional regulator [Actinomycetota bacterium]
MSPGRRVSRDLVCEELFGDLDPRAAARSVSKALSMARAALAGLGEPGEPAPALLEADLTHIWANPAVEVDAAEHEQALRSALAMGPGHGRDGLLATALADDGELLADEPYADWALRPRERLEALRQEARLALARDRARGAGDTRPEAQLAAWAACAEHDPASEEAAAALVRGYFAAGHRELAVRAYERCRAALGELGLGLSPWLEEVYATAAFEAGPPRTQAPAREELRTVSVLAAEVAAAGLADPEELRDVTGRGLAAADRVPQALGIQVADRDHLGGQHAHGPQLLAGGGGRAGSPGPGRHGLEGGGGVHLLEPRGYPDPELAEGGPAALVGA